MLYSCGPSQACSQHFEPTWPKAPFAWDLYSSEREMVFGRDSFGRDDDERVPPSHPDPPSNYPDELIEEADARARMSTFQHGELST